MAPDLSSSVWIPVCCGRVMRCNFFKQADGGSLAALVCTVCSKNITLEQEPLASVGSFGDGANVLSLLGSPKPPKTDRRRTINAFGSDEPTL